jgi:hypothetical protein
MVMTTRTKYNGASMEWSFSSPRPDDCEKNFYAAAGNRTPADQSVNGNNYNDSNHKNISKHSGGVAHSL